MPAGFGGKRTRKAKGGKRADLGYYVRSAWEANWARWLRYQVKHDVIQSFAYEPETFKFEGITRGVMAYTPDFRIVNRDGSVEYHEVKGYMDARSKTIMKRMAKYHPDVKVIIVDKEQYRAVERTGKDIIPNWE